MFRIVLKIKTIQMFTSPLMYAAVETVLRKWAPTSDMRGKISPELL